MNSKSEDHVLPGIASSRLLAFVRAMMGATHGREDDEHPLPPGPWDPVIRTALEQVRTTMHAAHVRANHVVMGPHPEPWKVVLNGILARHPEAFDAIGGHQGLADEVALNPQPLPPRFAFLLAVAQVLVARAELMQDLADAMAREGEQRGIIIVSGYLGRFSDDFCGNGFQLKWPFPGPRPHWFGGELDAIDLVVIATEFEAAAKRSFSPDLRRVLTGTGVRFVEAGFARWR